jgi:hypothetical protein
VLCAEALTWAARNDLRVSAGEAVTLPVVGIAGTGTPLPTVPVIEPALFSGTRPGSNNLAVRERVSLPAVRKGFHVDPQNQPRPNATTIVPANRQRRSMEALSDAVASKKAVRILPLNTSSVLGVFRLS